MLNIDAIDKAGEAVDTAKEKFGGFIGQLDKTPFEEFGFAVGTVTNNVHAMISGLEIFTRESQLAQVGAMLMGESISDVGRKAEEARQKVEAMFAQFSGLSMGEQAAIINEKFQEALENAGVTNDPGFISGAEIVGSQVAAMAAGGGTVVNVDLSGSTVVAEDIEDLVVDAMASAAARGRVEKSVTG